VNRTIQVLAVVALAALAVKMLVGAAALIHVLLHVLSGLGAAPAAAPGLADYAFIGGEQSVAPEPSTFDQALRAVDLLLSHGASGLLLAFGILGFAAFALWLRTAPGRRAWEAVKPIGRRQPPEEPPA
jgi:hypothetical protein